MLSGLWISVDLNPLERVVRHHGRDNGQVSSHARRKDKSPGRMAEKRDGVRKPLHKRSMIAHKPLKMDKLFASAKTARDMLMDVHKRRRGA